MADDMDELSAGEPKTKKWPDCCNDCTHEWQSLELTPDSNELLNIFLIVLGGLTILYGLLYHAYRRVNHRQPGNALNSNSFMAESPRIPKVTGDITIKPAISTRMNV